LCGVHGRCKSLLASWGEKNRGCTDIMETGLGALVELCRGALPIVIVMSTVKCSPHGIIADTFKHNRG